MNPSSEKRSSKILIFLLCLLFFVVAGILIIPQIPALRLSTLGFLFTAFQSFFLFLCFLTARVLIVAARRQKKLLSIAVLTALLSLSFSLPTAASPETVRVEAVPQSAEGELRILSWNTDKAVSQKDIIDLAMKLQPDIIALPEQIQPDFTVLSYDPAYTSRRTASQSYELGLALDMKLYYWDQASGQTLFISISWGLSTD